MKGDAPSALLRGTTALILLAARVARAEAAAVKGLRLRRRRREKRERCAAGALDGAAPALRFGYQD